ncbi:hypothetical protein [Mycoplasmopsis agassizii]|uniref:Uncharacterized protein n=1 Tax=Mycoplasmopsis agassizii TaxID=33922 RepID=A0ABX4H5J8_9BACT|nr:hypothetical protein [Mycoplasmopsis agassizii]PAF55173.1 hypothetical protein CJF60_00605 [Mycoplasmopsis agassizii]SMC16862.1 hypothetical protein SAMN02745179_00344 [Mycoplasmopsis agassizii]
MKLKSKLSKKWIVSLSAVVTVAAISATAVSVLYSYTSNDTVAKRVYEITKGYLDGVQVTPPDTQGPVEIVVDNPGSVSPINGSGSFLVSDIGDGKREGGSLVKIQNPDDKDKDKDKKESK